MAFTSTIRLNSVQRLLSRPSQRRLSCPSARRKVDIYSQGAQAMWVETRTPTQLEYNHLIHLIRFQIEDS
jgi:hypothetical protein